MGMMTTNAMNPITNVPSTFAPAATSPTMVTPAIMRHVDEKEEGENDLKEDDGLADALTKLQAGEKSKDKLDITPDMASKILKLIQQKGDRLEQKHREAALTDSKDVRLPQAFSTSKVKHVKPNGDGFTILTDIKSDSKDQRQLPANILRGNSDETKATSTYKEKHFDKPSPTGNVEYPRPKLPPKRPFLQPTVRPDVGLMHTVTPDLQKDDTPLAPELGNREDDLRPPGVNTLMSPYEKLRRIQAKKAQEQKSKAPIMQPPPIASSVS